MLYVPSADIVSVASGKQILLPIAEQEQARIIATESLRLLNCWLGVATKESIGSTFCVDCEFLQTCKWLYWFFDKDTGLHPAARARKVIKMYGLDSEYL